MENILSIKLFKKDIHAQLISRNYGFIYKFDGFCFPNNSVIMVL